MPLSLLLCGLNLHQPLGFRMLFAGRLLNHQAPFVDVAKVLPDLDEPCFAVAFDIRAVNPGAAALAVVALAVMLSYTLRQ